MKLVMFAEYGRDVVAPGILTPDGVVTLHDLLASAEPIPLSAGALRAPIPRPGKVLCCIANYWEHTQRDPRPLNMFLKNPDAVIGPQDTVRLPVTEEPYAFMHEAELGIVIKGPAKSVSPRDWRTAVFGYTAVVDVSARSHGRTTWRDGSWLGKSFDTFCPIGPVIVTADEVTDPHALTVRFWVDGALRHCYSTSDMEHLVPEIMTFASNVMTLNTGDVIACGTNHEGIGFIQHGERLTIEIEGFGAMELDVVDPLRRSWGKGIYLGEDSTNPAAPGSAPGVSKSACTVRRTATPTSRPQIDGHRRVCREVT